LYGGQVANAASRPGATPERVLAVYAHPDDPEVSCAGTLARWADEGAEVHLVVCARGDKGSSDPEVDPVALTALRAEEADAAAKVMGLAEHENLGHPDGEIDNTLELRAELVGRIRAFRPDVVVSCDPTAVFFGSRYVNHHDHRGVGFAVLDACSPAASSPLYFPDLGPAHRVASVYLSGTLHPDTWVDIESTLDRKVDALRCHRSQMGDDLDLVGEVVRRRAASAAAEADWSSGAESYAEAFRVLRI
jgi:LmbE family N-acetylglucosaminyl deacetylase